MQVLWQRNFEKLLYKEQDLEISTLNNVLKQPRLHRNKCVSIIKKSKRSDFESLDVKFVKDNKKFWIKISPLSSNKIKSKEKITLVENNEIISSDIEVANTFQNFFSSIDKNLNIQRDETHLSKTT